MTAAQPADSTALALRLAWPLVIAQMSLIAAILLMGSVPRSLADFSAHTPAALISLCGVLLGLWAIFAMRLGNFSVLPVPVEKAVLCTNGPYRWIRHPMYTAVMLVCAGACLTDSPAPCWLGLASLLAVLITKLEVEESLLARKFPDYASYIRNSKRLLPFLY